MSGVENLHGIDYQISYSVLTLLKIVQNQSNDVESIKFESLSEEEEDLNIYRYNGAKEFIQIKKKAEGYLWTPSEMKIILKKFHDKNEKDLDFQFVSNGGGNKTVTKLKKYLLEEKMPPDGLLNSFISSELKLSDLKSVLKKTTILTYEFPSNDLNNPSLVINQHIKDLLLSPKFLLSDSIDNIFSTLWKYVFDLSIMSKSKKISDIIGELKDMGINIANNVWFDLPNLKDFKGRKKEILEIKTALFQNNRVIVQGISGTGKTMTTAKLAQELNINGKKVLWLELSNILTSNDVLHTIACFFNDIGFSSQAQSLIRCEIANIPTCILNVLKKAEVYLIFDSLDKANIKVEALIHAIFKESIKCEQTGGIVLSSTDSIECYMQLDVITNKVFEYHLFGFSLQDTVLFFEENNIKFSIEDIEDFHKAVAGHPISLVFLKQLVFSKALKAEDIDKLKELSINHAWKWLFEKVFSTLKQEEKNLILNVSIFNYPFDENELKQVVSIAYRPEYLFNSLMKKDIVLSSVDLYTIHESIRSMLYDMISTSKKKELHNRAAEYYRHIMELAYRESGGVLYENIFKWGYHLEQLNEGKQLSKTSAKLLQLDAKYLDSLWAIERFGFPFSFNKTNLENINPYIDFLLDKGLIKENQDDTNKYFETVKRYALKGFDFFDCCFLHYLCITRGISNHLGYIEIFEPNYSFQVQGIICPWEHCIEYMPLPPLSDLCEEASDDMIAQPNLALDSASCPIFGHYCPGGEEQVSLCRQADDETDK